VPQLPHSARKASRLRRQLALAMLRLRRKGPSQALFWAIALVLGVAAGLAALVFRTGVSILERALYSADNHAVLAGAALMPWWALVAIPAVGGLVVGVILHRFTPDGRVRAVADVIEGAALRQGRVEVREGLASALASMITLGTGGSAGREGPVVHLAAVISTGIARKIDASGITGRDLLGCAVAGAVSASFNAPLAGAIFAMEVVLRHYALHAFAPIAIASVMGTVVNRLHFGDVAEFTLPVRNAVAFYWEIGLSDPRPCVGARGGGVDAVDLCCRERGKRPAGPLAGAALAASGGCRGAGRGAGDRGAAGDRDRV